MARYVIVNGPKAMVFNGFKYQYGFGPKPEWSQVDSATCRAMIMRETAADQALSDLKSFGAVYDECQIIPVGDLFG